MFLEKRHHVGIVYTKTLHRRKGGNAVLVPAAAFVDGHLEHVPLFAAVLLEQIDLLFHGEAADIDAEFFEFLVKVFGTRVPLVLPHGAEAAVRRFAVPLPMRRLKMRSKL